MQSGNITTSQITAGAIGAVTGVLGIKLAEYFLEVFLGNKYSEKDLDRLKSARTIYESTFRKPVASDPPISVIPEYWELNEGRPVFCFSPDLNYHSYLDELEHKREGTQNYYESSKALSKFISSYLAKRQKRLIDKGKKGDFLELFYIEWLRWSATTLPHYEYNDTSLSEFKKRLKYLTAARKKPNLLPHSKIPGDITKHNVLDFIERELNKCIAKTQEEMERKTAHEHFKNLKDKSNKMLNECLSFVFYNRKTPVHAIPLVADDYVQASLDTSYSAIEQKTLPIVTATHTGEMLRVLINYSQIDDQKYLNPKDNELLNYYFNPDFSPRNVKWDLERSDFPNWVPKVLYHQHLKLYQELCSFILDFIEMKRLIDKAYTLCTYKGTLWAYGSKQGKESVLGQLKSFENIVLKLSSKIAEVDSLNNELQALYNTDKRNNYDNPADFNLKDANNAYECYSSFKDFAIDICTEIQRQIHTFPIDIVKKVNKLEIEYCRDVRKAMLKHAPDDLYKFSYRENIEDNASNHSKSSQVNTRFLDETNNVLQFSFYEFSQAEFKRNIDHASASSSVGRVMLSGPWRLGDSYDSWMEGFFIRNENTFEHLKGTLSVELSEAFYLRNLTDVEATSLKIVKLLNNMSSYINDNRPKWRLFPLTAGWPFNRKADKFAKILLAKVDEKISAVNTFVAEKKEHIKACLPPSSAVQLVASQSAYQNSTTAVSLALAIINEQRASGNTFALNQANENVVPIVLKKWRISISDLVNRWAETEFTEKLIIFPSRQSAEDILAKFSNYRLALGNNTAEFLTICEDIKNSYKDYINNNHSLEVIDSASRYQINLLMRIIDVLSASPNSEQYQTSLDMFNNYCSEFFTVIVPVQEEFKEHNDENSHAYDSRHIIRTI